MDRIVQYAIVTSPNTDALVKTVSKMMNDGWQPMGGVCAVPEIPGVPYTGSYKQVIVKYEDSAHVR